MYEYYVCCDDCEILKFIIQVIVDEIELFLVSLYSVDQKEDFKYDYK